MSYQPIIFPELINKVWKEVDLALLAQEEFKEKSSPNMLLDPEFCNQWISAIAKKINADYTYGGHFEDRKQLWRGYYTEEKIVTHLGVDYNVPSGTLVAAPRNFTVIHSWKDTSIHNGWGGRLIVKLDEPWKNAEYLIFGHLAHQDLPIEGEKFIKGEIFAKTGIPIENGGWFPHLHVQCVNESFIKKYQHDLKELDGYFLIEGKPYDIAPDPTYLIGKD